MDLFSGRTHLPPSAAADTLGGGTPGHVRLCPRCTMESGADTPQHLCPRAVLDLDAHHGAPADRPVPPEMAAILEAMRLESHDNLCGCDGGPDACITPSYSARDAFAPSGYGERALELAITAGWRVPGVTS